MHDSGETMGEVENLNLHLMKHASPGMSIIFHLLPKTNAGEFDTKKQVPILSGN